MKFVVILVGYLQLIQGLVLSKDNERVYYNVENFKDVEDQPIVQYIDLNVKSDETIHRVTWYGGKNVYEVSFDNDQRKSIQFILRLKPKDLDAGAFHLVQNLEKIKQMVLWLNLYCDLHQDCDKNKLNEELTKVVQSAWKNEGVL